MDTTINKQQDIVKNLWEAVPQVARTGFFSSFFCGIITHLYVITNKLPNWDDLNHMDGTGATGEFGRFMLSRVHQFFSQISSPALNGTMGVLLYSLALALLLIAAKIKNQSTAVIAAFLWITFPAITGNMTFMFLGGTYGVAVFCAIAAVYCVTKQKWWFVPGALFLYCSLGIYQAYLPLAAASLLLILICDIFSEVGLREIMIRTWKAMGMLVIGTVGYYAKLRTLPLEGYRGISNVGSAGFFKQLPEAVLRAYHRILQYYVTLPPSYTTPFFRRIHILLMALTLITGLLLIVQYQVYREPARLALLALLTFLLPLAASAAYVIAPEVQHASTLMIFAYVTLLLLLPFLLEKLKVSRIKSLAGVLTIIGMITCFLCAYGSYRVAGEAYFRTSIAFERVENYYNRMFERLERMEGFRYGDGFVFAGDSWPEPNVLSAFNMDGEWFADLEGLALENGLFTSSTRNNFICTYLGIESPFISQEEYESILETEEFRAMPIYPADGCIKRIGDFWVVKVEK